MVRLPVLLLAFALAASSQTRIERLTSIVQQDPRNIPNILKLAALKLEEASGVTNEAERADALDEVQELYLRVNALDPRNFDALYHLGMVSWMKVFPAVVTARRDAAMDPETPGPVRDRSSRAVLNGKYRADIEYAIASLEQAIAIEPSNSEAMAFLQMAYRARADFKDTRAEWDSDQHSAGQWREKAYTTYQVNTAKQPEPEPVLRSLKPPTPSWAVVFMPMAIWVDPAEMEKKLINPLRTRCPPGLLVSPGMPMVSLSAVIDRDGSVLYLEPIEGPAEGISYAIEAAKKRSYLPTLLNGKATMVKTNIEIFFNSCLAQ